MDLLGDLLTVALVLVALWTFLPKALRRSAWATLGDGLAELWAGLRSAAGPARQAAGAALEQVAYRGLLGVPVPDAEGSPRSPEPERRSEGSPRSNAENAGSEGSATFAEPPRSAVTQTLPASASELRKLTHAITLYCARPNKEAAILAAWGATKGESPEYQRASALFDAALPVDARTAIKAQSRQSGTPAPPATTRDVVDAA